jgi:hypothetical protein
MALLTTGKPFIRDLEQYGALGVYAPLEGVTRDAIKDVYGHWLQCPAYHR